MTEENLSERATIKMTKLMKQELDRIAKEEGRSFGSLSRRIFGAWLRARKARKAVV